MALRCKAKGSPASAEIDKSRQESTELDKYRPKINQSRQKIDKSHQLSTEVNTLSTGIGAQCKECRGIIGENTRIGT